jgi:hypothetical protein
MLVSANAFEEAAISPKDASNAPRLWERILAS